MATGSLEERVAALEAQVASIFRPAHEVSRDDWRSTIGMFAGDATMREVCDEALRLREEERQNFHNMDAQGSAQ